MQNAERIVWLRDSFAVLQVPEAVEILRLAGLTPKRELAPEDAPHVAAIIVGLGKFGVEDARLFPNLLTVARFGAGADNVDAKALWAARRIRVSSTIDLATRDVAEFALGLIIMALRGAARDAKALGGNPQTWRVIDRTPALCDATVGIIGAGNIGIETARIVAQLASKVLVWNRSDKPLDLSGIPEGRIERVSSTSEMARRADVVSLHLALGEDTRGLIGKTFFDEVRRAGRSIALVNTARGEIVDETELLVALNDGAVHDAAIDVWSAEGVRSSEIVIALRAHPRVMATSHIGSHTDGVLTRYAMQCVRNVVALVEGRSDDIARYVVRAD